MALVEAKIEAQEGAIRELNQLLKDHPAILVAATILIVCVAISYLGPLIKPYTTRERTLRSNRERYPGLQAEIEARSERERRNEVHARPFRKQKIGRSGR